MKQVVKYVADDGSEWFSEDKCIGRDMMIAEVDRAMSGLKPRPQNGGFEGYIQHDRESVLKCKRMLFAIANRDGILKWWIDRQKNEHGASDESLVEQCHPSWFGRMLDGNHGPLEHAYGRLCAIDNEFREWNQAYFAANPGTGKMVCIG